VCDADRSRYAHLRGRCQGCPADAVGAAAAVRTEPMRRVPELIALGFALIAGPFAGFHAWAAVSAARCAAATPVSTIPLAGAGEGVRAGPLWFQGGDPQGLAGQYPSALTATKVVIYAPRRPADDYTLRGFECATGRSLRFSYPRPEGAYPLPTSAAPASVLRRSGTVTGVLYRFGQGGSRDFPPGLDYHGYILYAAPGDWKVVVRSGSRIVGSAVFHVVLTP
jgi:hypothetical protein